MTEIADIIARAACVHQRPTPASGQGDAYDVLSSWAKAGDVSADAELYALDMTARAILAALDRAGFVVVPKEPTDAMISAGLTSLEVNSGFIAIDRDPLFVWRFMLREAPK